MRISNGLDAVSRLRQFGVEQRPNVPALRTPDRLEGDRWAERLRVGTRDRVRRLRGHGARLDDVDLHILLCCLAAYAAGHLAHALWILPSLIRAHFFDFLAMPALLAGANLLAVSTPIRRAIFAESGWASVVTAMAILQWELIAPLYTVSTPDILDVIAYSAGAAGYVLYRRRNDPVALQKRGLL